MAENTEALTRSQSGSDEQDILNEDLFDFPCDVDFTANVRAAAEPDSALDDDIFDFAGHDAILASEGDQADLSSGAHNLELLVDPDLAEETQQAPLTSEEIAPDAPAPVAESIEAIGTSDLDEDLFNFNSAVAPDAPEAHQPLRHEDLIDKREPVAEVIEEATPAPQPAIPDPTTAPASTTADSLPPVSEVAMQSANEALAVAQAARLAILAQQPISGAPVADSGWNRRMVISIAAAFLLVNASLIFIAGRLSQSLNSALDGVREDLARSIPANQLGGAGAQVLLPPELQPTADGRSPAIELVPAQTSHAIVLTDVASRELELAHKEIEEAAFPAARRRLYRLLANRDRLIITADVLAEAQFLVAESYFAQAKRPEPTAVEAEQ